jgi:hypothetical protein
MQEGRNRNAAAMLAVRGDRILPSLVSFQFVAWFSLRTLCAFAPLRFGV